MQKKRKRLDKNVKSVYLKLRYASCTMREKKRGRKAYMEQKNAFKSSYGFIITIIGFAVGMGTIWRFPYLLGENGGALFLLAYIVLLAVVGIPVMCAEVSIGYATQKTAIKAYRELAPRRPWWVWGVIHLAACTMLNYAAAINGWAVNYLYLAITGKFEGLNADEIGALFGSVVADRWMILLCTAVYIVLVTLVLLGGAGRLEKINKIGLPMLGIIMAILIVVGVQMPGAGAGIEYILKPNFENFSLESLQTALGQTFFALGVGMVVLMNFGSYLKGSNENIAKSSIMSGIGLIIAGLMAGFMIFPALFASGVDPTSGPSLAFITLPIVFNHMPAGQLLSVLFYIGFIIAMMTSSSGAWEAVVGLYMDQFNLSRGKAIAVTVGTSGVFAVLGIFNDSIFNFLDAFVSNWLFTLGALAICIFCGWVWGIENCIAAMNVKNGALRKWLAVMIQYVCPVLIAFIFISQFF